MPATPTRIGSLTECPRWSVSRSFSSVPSSSPQIRGIRRVRRGSRLSGEPRKGGCSRSCSRYGKLESASFRRGRSAGGNGESLSARKKGSIAREAMPRFRDEDEERAFWAEHDVVNYFDWEKSVL